jgi:hypothetical protein
VATTADAVIGPTPGIVASRRLALLSLCQATIATSISFTRLSSASSSASLIEDTFKLPYRILKNNDFGIIAAWSIAEIEPGMTQVSLGAFVVVIDKRTLDFRRSNVIMAEPGEATSYGSCIKS